MENNINKDKLIQILTEQKSIIKELVKLEHKKIDVLKNVDIDELQRINSLEDELVKKNETLEIKREKLLNNITHKLDSIKDKDIEKIKEELKEETIKLRNLLKINKEIIKSNLEIINSVINYAELEGDTNYCKNIKNDKFHLINHIA